MHTCTCCSVGVPMHMCICRSAGILMHTCAYAVLQVYSCTCAHPCCRCTDAHVYIHAAGALMHMCTCRSAGVLIHMFFTLKDRGCWAECISDCSAPYGLFSWVLNHLAHLHLSIAFHLPTVSLSTRRVAQPCFSYWGEEKPPKHSPERGGRQVIHPMSTEAANINYREHG